MVSLTLYNGYNHPCLQMNYRWCRGYLDLLLGSCTWLHLHGECSLRNIVVWLRQNKIMHKWIQSITQPGSLDQLCAFMSACSHVLCLYSLGLYQQTEPRSPHFKHFIDVPAGHLVLSSILRCWIQTAVCAWNINIKKWLWLCWLYAIQFI